MWTGGSCRRSPVGKNRRHQVLGAAETSKTTPISEQSAQWMENEAAQVVFPQTLNPGRLNGSTGVTIFMKVTEAPRFG